MFPVAFAVMENESEESWEWFLRLLHEAIGMPEGLVISSDMQKGLQNAIENVYPLAEHRECMRHLFSNFKKKFRGDLFKFGLWGAARTYSQSHFDDLIAEIDANCPAAMEFLNKEHTKLWSRSKFGTISKCDYLTNNIAEVFNSWISEERHKPIIDLIDAIRQRIMVRFNERRRIVRNWKGSIVPKVLDYIKLISRGLNTYSVHRSSEVLAEVTKNGLRWEVNLEERRCSCRAWQVKGVPCVHAASLIASIRNARWEDYVDSYFTVTRLKTTYSNGIAPMPSKDKWMKYELGYKMLPPILKRPVGRPRKSSRIKAWDEPTKRSHKCTRCGLYGHYRNTCKNAVPSQDNEDSSSGSNRKRNANIGATQPKKKACPSTIFKILEKENI
ncbi:uncharacterized protein LOC144562060 [Carex rostrata]